MKRLLCFLTILLVGLVSQASSAQSDSVSHRASALVNVLEARITYLGDSSQVNGCSVARLFGGDDYLGRIPASLREHLGTRVGACSQNAGGAAASVRPAPPRSFLRVDSIVVAPDGRRATAYLVVRKYENYWEETHTLIRRADEPNSAVPSRRTWVFIGLQIGNPMIVR